MSKRKEPTIWQCPENTPEGITLEGAAADDGATVSSLNSFDCK